jgi:hypothetical protein
VPTRDGQTGVFGVVVEVEPLSELLASFLAPSEAGALVAVAVAVELESDDSFDEAPLSFDESPPLFDGSFARRSFL